MSLSNILIEKLTAYFYTGYGWTNIAIWIWHIDVNLFLGVENMILLKLQSSLIIEQLNT